MDNHVQPQSVRLLGSSVAALLFELSESKGDLEGFIFGSELQRTVEVQNDREENVQKTERFFVISSCTPLHEKFSFYDAAGNVDHEKLKNLIPQDKAKMLIGFFRCRRDIPMQCSVRDLHIMEGLIEYYGKHIYNKKLQRPTPDSSSLLLGLVSATVNENMATHTYDYTFMHRPSYDSCRLEAVQVGITCLDQSSHTDYNRPPPAPLSLPSNVTGLGKRLLAANGRTQEMGVVEEMYGNILGEMKRLCEEVMKGDKEVARERLRLRELRAERAENLRKRDMGALTGPKYEDIRHSAVHRVAYEQGGA
eukprot:comp60100_c0_seq1/m.47873 comp60100_c0_seq1/g.47873  ORF comp60100_c0_seq1/g.47873 comp60100_c0_seq1/m.47873 type:complete len:307 (-) comp60100_c0_seq1:193-1113(-)